MTRVEYMRLLRARRRLRWRCIVCGERAPRGSLCTKHRRQKKAKARRLYQKRKCAGLCIQCGAPAVNGTRCEPHRIAHKVRQALYEERSLYRKETSDEDRLGDSHEERDGFRHVRDLSMHR